MFVLNRYSIIYFLIPWVLFAQTRAIIGYGQAVLGSDITIEQAKKIALDQARLDALQKFGVYVEKNVRFEIYELNGKMYESYKTEIITIAGSIARLVNKREWQEYKNGFLTFYVTAEYNLDEYIFKQHLKKFFEERRKEKRWQAYRKDYFKKKKITPPDHSFLGASFAFSRLQGATAYGYEVSPTMGIEFGIMGIFGKPSSSGIQADHIVEISAGMLPGSIKISDPYNDINELEIQFNSFCGKYYYAPRINTNLSFLFGIGYTSEFYGMKEDPEKYKEDFELKQFKAFEFSGGIIYMGGEKPGFVLFTRYDYTPSDFGDKFAVRFGMAIRMKKIK